MLTAPEFHALHRPGTPLLLPNAWDLASARWLHAGGHDVVGTTSLGVAVEAGKPDGGGETAEETVELAGRIAARGIAVTVDLESGFSDDPDEVGRLAGRLAALGAVGVNLEDSDASGRLVSAELAAAKVAAVAAAAPGLYVNARTDVYWIAAEPAPSDEAAARELHAEAVRRARRYLDAGASGAFVPGAFSPDTIRSLTEAIPAPLNVLVQPAIPIAELGRLGVARVSTGSLLFRTALGAITDAMSALATGATGATATHTAPPSYDAVAGLD